MRRSRILIVLLAAAVVGVTTFAIHARRAVTVETPGTEQALVRLSAVRAELVGLPPMVIFDANGRPERAPPPADTARGGAAVATPEQLRVLAWRPASGRLVAAEVPFWFLALKGPALGWVLRGTDFDPAELGLTSDALERHGPGLVLDRIDSDGNQLLVWLE